MSLDFIEEPKYLLLQGSYEEMGFEHGTRLRKRIEAGVEGFLKAGAQLFQLPYPLLSSYSKHCERHIPARYLAEMHAIAEGSGVHYDDILSMNCIADVDGCLTAKVQHCCNFLLTPSVTETMELLHGRNLDFPLTPELQSAMSVWIARSPSDSSFHPTLSITLAGTVGTFTGLSRSKISVGEVSTPSSNSSTDGVPISLLLRSILERADNLDEAFSMVKGFPRTCGFNLALGDGKTGEARSIEYTRNLCSMRGARQGVLIVDDCCMCARTARNRLTNAAGTFRYARMRSLIDGHQGSFTEATALSFLSDNYDLGTGKHGGRSYNCICNYNTVLSVLMLPTQLKVLVADERIPAPTGTYKMLDMNPVWLAG